MLFAGNDRRTVFLLGAGASRGAVPHVLHNRKRLKAPLNGDYFKVADTYARAEGANSQARKRLDRLLQAFKQDLPLKGHPTMEQAFSLLYVAKDFPEIYRAGPGRRPPAGERREIEDFLRLLFPILTKLDQGNDGESGYDRFATRLGQSDTLITLNYDTMLDSALHRRGWDPKRGYALAGDKSKVKWRPVVLPTGQASLGVTLLKLHGSTNWFVRGSISNLKKVFSSKPVKVTAPRENEIFDHVRQIAPPMFGKIFEHDHWRKLWTRAFNDFCEAEVFVVIGCSLIDTDFHLRALLGSVVRRRKQDQNRFARVFFVDCTKVRRKWMAVMKGSYVKVHQYNSFEKFLRQGVRV